MISQPRRCASSNMAKLPFLILMDEIGSITIPNLIIISPLSQIAEPNLQSGDCVSAVVSVL